MSPRTNFFVDEYRVPKYMGPCSIIEESEEEGVDNVDIFDNIDDGDDGLENNFSDLESYVIDSEMDPKDKIQAWIARFGENAFASLQSFS